MFQTSSVHQRGDSCICYIGECVLEHTRLPTRQLTPTHVRKTQHTAHRMNTWGSKNVGDKKIKNYISIYRLVHFVGFCCIII